MKICKIISDKSAENTADNYSIILLCEYCYQVDSKREKDSLVISSEEYNSDYGVSCEACYKSVAEEREEKDIASV